MGKLSRVSCILKRKSQCVDLTDANLTYDSDYEAQKIGHKYASWRSAFNLRDALMYIILGGDKILFAEITGLPLTPPSMDRLSMTAISYHKPGPRGPPSTYFFHIFCRYHLCSTV